MDKINQFSQELSNPATPKPEKLLALKFTLHFVGDVHQPLHAADDHDRGGNGKLVSFENRPTCIVLHAYWDTTLVGRLGPNFNQVAEDLINQFNASHMSLESLQPKDWALESFKLARDVVYKLPIPVLDERGHQCSALSHDYEDRALATVREQLFKAGMRLAITLNQALRVP